MIGFLVHDERLFPADEAIRACRALRTYSYQSTENVGPIRIHFFRNASPNNYLTRDDRYTVCVSGTLIFNNAHGSKALDDLREALHRGTDLADISKQLRGPYSLVQVDRLAKQVCILNSREGLRNCFASQRNDFRAYSTNLLLLAALTNASPCPEAIRHFIHVGALLEEKTIFENVERLPAASFHTYRNESWTTSRLWRLVPSTPADVTRQEATKILTESFVRNLEFTAGMDLGRVAADLTGGTDSRMILCCLMEKHAKPVTSTGGPQDLVDVRIARRIADKLGIEHYRYEPDEASITDEAVACAVEVADGNREVITLTKLLPYYKEKARRFDLITGGEGGPLFKDHYWLFEFNRVGLNREPHWDRIAKLSILPFAFRDDYFSGFSDRIVDNIEGLLRRRSATVQGTNNQKLDFVYFDMKTPAFAGPGFSVETQFMDVFHPMLDGENVQYSINLPPAIRIRNILQFGMIQGLRPELRWIPTDKGLPTIPPVGVNSWLRLLRGRRYVETAVRKLRTTLVGSGNKKMNRSRDVECLQKLGYFDLLEHSSLVLSSAISASKLAKFKDSPEKQPNRQYLLNTLSVQLFFRRMRELRNAANTVASVSPVSTT